MLNKFPSSLAAGNALDLGRGRLIPQYPWESMMAPIGEWMGLDTAQLDVAFPNLVNFNPSHIILDLFREL